MDNRKRTLLKTITWRIMAVISAMALVYIYNRDIRQSVAISLTINLVNMLLYYTHERIWNKLNFGRENS